MHRDIIEHYKRNFVINLLENKDPGQPEAYWTDPGNFDPENPETYPEFIYNPELDKIPPFWDLSRSPILRGLGKIDDAMRRGHDWMAPYLRKYRELKLLGIRHRLNWSPEEFEALKKLLFSKNPRFILYEGKDGSLWVKRVTESGSIEWYQWDGGFSPGQYGPDPTFLNSPQTSPDPRLILRRYNPGTIGDNTVGSWDPWKPAIKYLYSTGGAVMPMMLPATLDPSGGFDPSTEDDMDDYYQA